MWAYVVPIGLGVALLATASSLPPPLSDYGTALAIVLLAVSAVHLLEGKVNRRLDNEKKK